MGVNRGGHVDGTGVFSIFGGKTKICEPIDVTRKWKCFQAPIVVLVGQIDRSYSSGGECEGSLNEVRGGGEGGGWKRGTRRVY